MPAKAFLFLCMALPVVAAELCEAPSDGTCMSRDVDDSELVALQVEKPKHNKHTKHKVHRPKVQSLVDAEVNTYNSGDNEFHDVYEGTSETNYEDILLKLGTSKGMDKCTLPLPLTRRFKFSKAGGYAHKGMRTLMEMMDEPTRKAFTYIRYGDNEWRCTMALEDHDESKDKKASVRKAICDQMLQDMEAYGNRPSARLRDPWNLFLGVGTGYLCKEEHAELHENVTLFLKDGVVKPSFTGWMDSFYFPLVPSKETAAMFRDRPVPLLNNRKVVVVGPKHLGALEGLLHHVHHVEIPYDQVRTGSVEHFWKAQSNVYKEMLEQSNKHANDNVVFLVAGGLPSKLLMFKAYRSMGHKDTIIDVGSSLDIFGGHGQHTWNQDLGRICRDYPHYMGQEVCLDFVAKHMHVPQAKQHKQVKEDQAESE